MNIKTIAICLLLLFTSLIKADNNAYFQSIIENTDYDSAPLHRYNIGYNGLPSTRDNALYYYYYHCELSRKLTMGELDAFLDEGKRKRQNEWFAAILDAIDLREWHEIEQPYLLEDLAKFFGKIYWKMIRTLKENVYGTKKRNQTDIQVKPADQLINKRLQALKTILMQRIQKIENQLKKRHYFDYEYLTYAGACYAVSVLLSYLSCMQYSQIDQKKIEYVGILDTFKKEGVLIFDRYEDIPSCFKTLKFPLIYFHDPSNPYMQVKWWVMFPTKKPENAIIFDRYSSLRDQEAIGYFDNWLKSGACAALTLIPLFYTAKFLKKAFNPNADNKYLKKYKKLLQFIEYLEKHGYDGCRFNA